MTSHKVIHGRLAKGKNFTNQDAFHMIHEMSHGQRSFFREMALQHLGRPPSKFWGEQPMPISFQNIDKPTMVHIVRALNHPHHVTSELILQNQKSAAGWASMGRTATIFWALPGKPMTAPKFLPVPLKQDLRGPFEPE